MAAMTCPGGPGPAALRRCILGGWTAKRLPAENCHVCLYTGMPIWCDNLKLMSANVILGIIGRRIILV